jgi:hypothetical protein
MRGPKFYGSIEEFEREELRMDMKCGWSLDDLYAEAAIERRGGDVEPEETEEDQLRFD